MSKRLPAEALLDLRRRLDTLPPRSTERRALIRETAALYGVAEVTLYRALQNQARPKAIRRSDSGAPRVMAKPTLERYCEIIAAIKVRTSNKQGRHLSTAEAIRLLEQYGIETPEGLIQAPAEVLKKTTVNRYLKQWGYDRQTLLKPPPAVRFQAQHSNECWHFDLSPSDLKHVKAPAWMEEGRGHPLLMLYSIVDDRSGVAYQEYHGVYGEDVEAALRFLFAAMSPKPTEEFPLHGIPQMIYMDNGPIARSGVFHQVMKYLGVEVRTHLPQGKDGRRVTARSKGKVERPFRTVKEMHETLYHFNEPETEAEANAWLMPYLMRYNTMQHRSEPHSRFEDWLKNLPPSGIRAMCSWERYCTFARDAERRKVGVDARLSVEGAQYEVDPELAGETVILWWGLFDNELYAEHRDKRYGPYRPVGGPIPLHRYRRFKKTKTEQRADRIEVLANQLALPREALADASVVFPISEKTSVPEIPFVDPDPFQEFTYPSIIAAKLAIADEIVMPLAKLPPETMAAIDALLAQTLRKADVLAFARQHLRPHLRETRMLSEVMAHYGLTQEFDYVGYFETAQHQHLMAEIKKTVKQGKLVAISGIVGCGKTTTLLRIQDLLAQEQDMVVSKSLAVDKDRVNLGTLIHALFCDLSTEKEVKVPTQAEKRERQLVDLVRKRRKTVALFVDEAHDIHGQTLLRLKRLIELVRASGGKLSVVLAGYPKLTNDLRRANMEEIGSRATVFILDGVKGEQEAYITWLLEQCTQEDQALNELITDEALALLVERLSTPLQIEYYLSRAFEEGYRAGQKPITPEVINTALVNDLDDLEPRLTRHGYNVKALSEVLNVRPREIRSFLQGKLPPSRTQELQQEMLAVGIPL